MSYSSGRPSALSIGSNRSSNSDPFRRKSSVASASGTTIDQVYLLKDTLGKGTTCVVKRGVHKKTGEHFAVKIVDLSVLSPEQVKRCHNEVEILKQCDHPNIITLHEVYHSGSTLYLVIDLMEGGDLFDRIVSKEKFSERDASLVINKVVSALEYLHSRGIVHRDLKPENLLYAGKGDRSEIKMADFGLSKINFNPSIVNSPCGTPGWCAPEILKLRHYGKAVDMWSVGVILYTMLCGYPPFDLTISTPTLHQKVIRGEFDYPAQEWSKISREAKDLVQHLMKDDANKRYTAREAGSHPWLSSATDNLLDSPRRLRANKGARTSVDMANAMQRMNLDEKRAAPSTRRPAPGSSAKTGPVRSGQIRATNSIFSSR